MPDSSVQRDRDERPEDLDRRDGRRRNLGHWDGVPMAFLVRMALEEADNLDEAHRRLPRPSPNLPVFLRRRRRQLEPQAVGLEASWDAFKVVRMGEAEPRLPHADSRRRPALDRDPLRGARPAGQVWDSVTFDAESARHLMDRPVAMKSNLHSVLFETSTTRFWVANASTDGQPAVEPAVPRLPADRPARPPCRPTAAPGFQSNLGKSRPRPADRLISDRPAGAIGQAGIPTGVGGSTAGRRRRSRTDAVDHSIARSARKQDG